MHYLSKVQTMDFLKIYFCSSLSGCLLELVCSLSVLCLLFSLVTHYLVEKKSAVEVKGGWTGHLCVKVGALCFHSLINAVVCLNLVDCVLFCSGEMFSTRANCKRLFQPNKRRIPFLRSCDVPV